MQMKRFVVRRDNNIGGDRLVVNQERRDMSGERLKRVSRLGIIIFKQQISYTIV